MTTAISCACGKLRGEIAESQKLYANHFICYCDDCQTFAHYLGKAFEVLDAHGGTDVVPVYPARIKIHQGFENLKCVRLSEKGLYRWYAGCCRAPLANSLSGKLGYIGLVSQAIPEPERARVLGPIRGKVLAKFGIPPLPADAHPGTPASLILTTLKSILIMFLKGLRKPSPFFDPLTGKPLVSPEVLTLAERQELRRRLHGAGSKTQ